MSRAAYSLTTPQSREARYIRATPPVAVELHQPIAPGEVRTIPGRVLGEMRVNGCVHHYRVVDGDGVLLLVPPEWIGNERAMVAAKLANMSEGRPSNSANLQSFVSQASAGEKLNVSTRSVADAAKVQDKAAPEIIARVERGSMPVSVAAKIANMPLGGVVYRSANLQSDTISRASASLPTLPPVETSPPLITQPEAARLLNVGERSVRAARATPETIAKVERGEVFA